MVVSWGGGGLVGLLFRWAFAKNRSLALLGMTTNYRFSTRCKVAQMQRYAQVAKRETADADRCGTAERKSLIPEGMSYRRRDEHRAASEGAVHHVGVGVAGCGMKKCSGEAADNFEAETLPEAHGAFVGADDEVELHGAKATVPGVIEGMSAHGADYAETGGGRSGHVTAVGDVGTAAVLIGAKEIGAEDVAVVVGNEDVVGGREPKRESGGASDVARKSVGFAGAKDGFEDGPDVGGVGGNGGTNREHGRMIREGEKAAKTNLRPGEGCQF
jgi:hypothetical protein